MKIFILILFLIIGCTNYKENNKNIILKKGDVYLVTHFNMYNLFELHILEVNDEYIKISSDDTTDNAWITIEKLKNVEFVKKLK